MYCLVVTDDFSRFSWVFFLATKDETSEILKTFITGIENLIDFRVKVIGCDNGTEFKNKIMNQFCEVKGIKKEFSVVGAPQQNGVAERKNKTLIEAARTMLADLKLPTTFWAKAVNTACYVQNRVLVIKPHNKTPYELFLGRKPALSFMRPFGCPELTNNTIAYIKLPTAEAYGTLSIFSIFFLEEGQSLSVSLKLGVRGELTTLALSMSEPAQLPSHLYCSMCYMLTFGTSIVEIEMPMICFVAPSLSAIGFAQSCFNLGKFSNVITNNQLIIKDTSNKR
ncbi:putative ribonuclease H-like domain-containing protein [Tanacetum coccineum]